MSKKMLSLSIAFALILSMFAGVAPAVSAVTGTLDIEAATWQKNIGLSEYTARIASGLSVTKAHSGGVLYVQVRNNTDIDITPTSFKLNGVELSTKVNTGVTFYRMQPEKLKPGELGTVIMQTGNYNNTTTVLTEGSAFTFQVAGNSVTSNTYSGTATTPKLRVGQAIPTSDYTKFKLFIRNDDTVDYTISQVKLNNNVASWSAPASNVVRAGLSTVVTVNLTTPTYEGQIQSLNITTSSGLKIASTFKTFNPKLIISSWDAPAEQDSNAYLAEMGANVNYGQSNFDTWNIVQTKQWGMPISNVGAAPSNWPNFGAASNTYSRGEVAYMSKISTYHPNNSGVRFYTIYDEPDNASTSNTPYKVAEAYKTYQKLDPTHLLNVNVTGSKNFMEYTAAVDMASTDKYQLVAPLSESPTGGMFPYWYARLLKELNEPRPTLPYSQGTSSAWSSRSRIGTFSIRSQAWWNIMSGSVGLNWFQLRADMSTDATNLRSTTQFPAMQRVNQELKAIENEILYSDVSYKLTTSNTKAPVYARVGEDCAILMVYNANFVNKTTSRVNSSALTGVNIGITLPEWFDVTNATVMELGRSNTILFEAPSGTNGTVAKSNKTINITGISLAAHDNGSTGNVLTTGEYGGLKVYVIRTGTKGTDTIAPSAPATADVVQQNPYYYVRKSATNYVALTWAESADNNGVRGYAVYKNGVVINSSNTAPIRGRVMNFTGSWGTYDPTATYTVKAVDFAGNLSAATQVVDRSAKFEIRFNKQNYTAGEYAYGEIYVKNYGSLFPMGMANRFNFVMKQKKWGTQYGDNRDFWFDVGAENVPTTQIARGLDNEFSDTRMGDPTFKFRPWEYDGVGAPIGVWVWGTDADFTYNSTTGETWYKGDTVLPGIKNTQGDWTEMFRFKLKLNTNLDLSVTSPLNVLYITDVTFKNLSEPVGGVHATMPQFGGTNGVIYSYGNPYATTATSTNVTTVPQWVNTEDGLTNILRQEFRFDKTSYALGEAGTVRVYINNLKMFGADGLGCHWFRQNINSSYFSNVTLSSGADYKEFNPSQTSSLYYNTGTGEIGASQWYNYGDWAGYWTTMKNTIGGIRNTSGMHTEYYVINFTAAQAFDLTTISDLTTVIKGTDSCWSNIPNDVNWGTNGIMGNEINSFIYSAGSAYAATDNAITGRLN